MQKLTFLAVFFCLLVSYPGHAQFFQKVSDDFEFNGIDLGRKGHEHTVGCTLLEEHESYRVYAPKKNTIKTKKFTLTDIIYLTNMRNEIYQIQGTNTGDFIEQAQLRLDLVYGAEGSDSYKDASDNYLFYKFSRTTNVYSQKKDSDTAYVYILMDWCIHETEEYQKNHTFLPVLGNSVKERKVIDYLFSLETPEKRSGYEELKWLHYYHYGIEFYLHSDTIMQAKVFNKNDEYEKFTGQLPFDLTMNDTRMIIREKFGDPPSASPNGNIYYYRKPGLQVHITFSNGKEPAADEDKIDQIVFAVKND